MSLLREPIGQLLLASSAFAFFSAILLPAQEGLWAYFLFIALSSAVCGAFAAEEGETALVGEDTGLFPTIRRLFSAFGPVIVAAAGTAPGLFAGTLLRRLVS